VRELITSLEAAPAVLPPARLRPIAPFEPFPLGALPLPLQEYVRQGAAALGCDVSYIALPALAVAASLIGNTRVIRLKRTWREPAIVWSVIIGDSGTLKSPAYDFAVAPLFRIQQQLKDEYDLAAAQFLEEKLAYEVRKRNKDQDPGRPPTPPVYRRVITSDLTVESLAGLLEDNGKGFLTARDEVAGWLTSFTRYKGKQGGSDLPHWLQLFRAGPLVVDRKTGDKKHYFIPRASVSVTGGIQPGILAQYLSSEAFSSGLAARLLMAWPPKQPKRWTEADVDEKTEEKYRELLRKLHALKPATDSEGKPEPHVLRLDNDARAAWITFYGDFAQTQVAVEGDIAAAFSKLEGYAARFALLHHVVSLVDLDVDDRRPVGRCSIDAGVTLSRWFARETERIYSMLAESAEERDIRNRVEFIRSRGGEITARELMRGNCRRYPDTEAAEAALEELAQAGLGDWVESPAGPKGGRPRRAFQLRMTHDTTDKTPGRGERGESEGDPAAHDATTSGVLETPEITGNHEVLSVVSCVMHEGSGAASLAEPETGTERGSVRGGEVLSCAPPYLHVRNDVDLQVVLAALGEADMVAIDTETTGLNPHRDRLRLLSLALPTVDGGTFVYLVDSFAVDPAPLLERLAEHPLIIHNAAFDLAFLFRLGFAPAQPVHCTMLMAQLLTNEHLEKVSLQECCRRYLGRKVDKSEQRSDWSGELTEGQLAYAALDAEVLVPLFRLLTEQIREAGLERAAAIEACCVPAMAWLQHNGVAVDREAWQALAEQSRQQAGRLRRELDELAPPRDGEFVASWNWDSNADVKKLLIQLGFAVENAADQTLAGIDHPLAAKLRAYRAAQKLATSYGLSCLAAVGPDGRIHANWKQLGAPASGRMSCSAPNLQQLPQDEYRRCVVAPPGRVLVKADYSQIELRIAAVISKDKALLEAYRRGDDLHTRTAQHVLGVEQVSKNDRKLAKALNFGLLYGMGAPRFRETTKADYGLDLTEEQAKDYRAAFFRAYPGLRSWHRAAGRNKDQPIETRTLAGRRRLNVVPFTQRLNTPVQGTGADGLKTALALLWERRGEVPGSFPVLAVHDEIVVECDEDQADAVAVWLQQAMIDAMAPLIDPVPVGVEVQAARTWGGH
jgi:DNA polymerase I-like protein with 3'-5' exonuclease and polymerase domains